VGLDKIVESRIGKTGMGSRRGQEPRGPAGGDLLAMVQPEDMLKYGLIPSSWDGFPWWPRYTT